MLVKEAKTIARQWVLEEAAKLSGFAGAFYAGSTNWMAEDAVLSPTSDLDIMVVLSYANPPNKPGKFIYRGVLLEVTYLPYEQLQSPEQVLDHYHLAGSFRKPNIILDPSGQLTQLQAAVAQGYTKRSWVYRRCTQARQRIEERIQSLNEPAPFHDLVTAWLFAAGGMSHVPLVAGLKNPTVRRRYVAARELLAQYGWLDYYATLLELLGCDHMSRARVEYHLAALTQVFDAAKVVAKTPFFFTSDLSDAARPIAIEGSWEMIERGYHREAVFWIAATYSRCQKVLYHDAPEMQQKFDSGYRHLLSDLGIAALLDLQQRSEQVKAALPELWQVTEAILDANPEIEE